MVSAHQCSVHSSVRAPAGSPSTGRRAPDTPGDCRSECRPDRTGRSRTGHRPRSGCAPGRSRDRRGGSWDSAGSTGPAPAAEGSSTACGTADRHTPDSQSSFRNLKQLWLYVLVRDTRASPQDQRFIIGTKPTYPLVTKQDCNSNCSREKSHDTKQTGCPTVCCSPAKADIGGGPHSHES